MDKNSKQKNPAAMVKALNAVLICLIGIGVSAYLIFAPRPSKSGIENRDLKTFPEFTPEAYFNASYTADITEWFTDTAPNRDDYKNAVTKIRSYFGITPKVFIVGPVDPTEESEDERPVGDVSDPFDK